MANKEQLSVFTFAKQITNKIESLNRIKEIYPELIEMCGAEREAAYSVFKEQYKWTARDIEAIRKDVNNFQPPEESNEPEEIIISDEDKATAIEYLKSSELISNIIYDIQQAGNVLGERNNLLLLYLVYTSRILDKPISCVTYSQSGTGKSFINKRVLDLFPPEKKKIFSSMSARSLEYLDPEDLNHTNLYIEEVEGAFEVLASIRIVQSESKLNRSVVIQNPKTNKYITQHAEKDAPCVICYTTTMDSIHNENSTRVFEIYCNESLSQTAKIVRNTLNGFDPQQTHKEQEKTRITNLHHNIQRILQPYRVYIPFNQYLVFPNTSVRHRRDSERFRVLIELIAIIRQFQKKIITVEGVQYIEADLVDYTCAFELSRSVFNNAMHQLSTRAKSLLRVIDHYCLSEASSTFDNQFAQCFTLRKICSHAKKMKLDFNNLDDVRKQMDNLAKFEFVELVSGGGKGSTCRYSRTELLFDDENNITKNLISPNELEVKIRTMSIAN